jgi:hypothetical protein
LRTAFKLNVSIVSYLLATQPDPHQLTALIAPRSLAAWSQPWYPKPLTTKTEQTTAEPSPGQQFKDLGLVLPAPLMTQLEQLCQVLQTRSKTTLSSSLLTLSPLADPMPLGQVVVWVGQSGTGKTMAARAIAQTLHQPLYTLDLDLINPDDAPSVLNALVQDVQPLILIRAAEKWLGRGSPCRPESLQKFWHQRRSQGLLTIWTTTLLPMVKQCWQRQSDQILEFPFPDRAARELIWQTVLPASIQVDADVQWSDLARWKLSGGAIQTIAHAALQEAATSGLPLTLGLRHLQDAKERYSHSYRIHPRSRRPGSHGGS